MRLWVWVVGVVLWAGAAAAQGLVPAGRCALVVAARPTLAEVAAFQAEYPRLGFGPVWLAANGVYVITLGLRPRDGARAEIDALIRRGAIPADSYCARGSDFVRVVAEGRIAAPAVPPAAPDRFDPALLSVAELRALQARLALAGHYSGLLDGVWGPMSGRALAAAARLPAGAEPRLADAAAVFQATEREWAGGGWRLQRFPQFGVALMLPMARMRLDLLDDVTESWSAPELLVIASGGLTEALPRLHAVVLDVPAHRGEPYILRERDRWVTSVRAEGFEQYMRSDRLASGLWATVMLIAPEGSGALRLAIASIGPVSAPAPDLPRSGMLAAAVAAGGSARPAAPPVAPPPVPPVAAARPAAPAPRPVGSGTAFFVSPAGHLLTNAHVVEGCARVTVAGRAATLVATDPAWDLALLRLPALPEGRAPLPLAALPPGLNADVTIAGYPLQEVLSGLNITRGNVSNLTGPRGDQTRIQITAPVQPGNSGGPVVDRRGQVVGVVVSRMAPESGAQNANFAVQGTLARLFLAVNGVELPLVEAGEVLEAEEIGRRLAAATVMAVCEG